MNELIKGAKIGAGILGVLFIGLFVKSCSDDVTAQDAFQRALCQKSEGRYVDLGGRKICLSKDGRIILGPRWPSVTASRAG